MAIDTTTPTTVAGKTETTGKTAGQSRPGRRTENPLSKFSSYTYQLSLYMITPNAYARFIASGRKDLGSVYSTRNDLTTNPTYPDGAYLVAQSGGFGDSSNGTTNNLNVRRAPGMENLALTIDNLKIVSAITGKATQEASNTTNFSFTVYEPYGFSFLTRLKYAMNTLAKASNGKMPTVTSPFRQFFIIGVRFQGYDENGNIITGDKVFANDTKNVAGNSSGIFERFFDVTIHNVKFNLAGGTSTYNITAAPTNGKSNSVTLGRINNKIILEGATVGEMLDSLKAQLNEMDKIAKQNVNNALPNTYNFEFSEDSQNNFLSAKIIEQDKSKSAPSNVTNSGEVTERAGTTARYNSTVKKIEIPKDTTVLQAIQQIVKQSEYFNNGLTVITSSSVPDKDTSAYPSENTNSNTILNNYSIGSKIIPKQFNTQLNDWAYDITYLIQPYLTPSVDSVYAGNVAKYYGPHKRYDYWFTGKNTEIISLEFNYNYLYYNTAVANYPINENLSKFNDVPIATNLQDNQSRLNSLNYGFGPQNSYLTSLYDPSAYVNLRMRVLGDPDYLMVDSPTTLQGSYNRFYGPDGFTINPNGGQVFVEVNFKEGIDYDWGEGNEGLFLINDNVLFWDYPKEMEVKGVSFYLMTVTSFFEGGKFTQELLLNINNTKKPISAPAAERGSADQETNRTANANNNSNNGTKKEPPVSIPPSVVSSNKISDVNDQSGNLPPFVEQEGRSPF